MTKRISIGRNPQSDFCILQNYDRVSNNHADIEEKNGHLYYTDHSSNGTVINGKKIYQSQVEIFQGDDIRLANTYQLSWNTIRQFFPISYNPTRPMQSNEGYGRPTQMYNPLPANQPHPDFSELPNQQNHNNYRNQDVRFEVNHAKSSWNWGAFLLGWIWAVGHGIIWPLFAIIGLALFLIVLPIIFPPIMIVTISIYNLLVFALSIYLGAKGSCLAWENGCFESVEHFKTRERKWTIAGLVIYGILFLGGFIMFIVGFGLLSTLFSL